jgi:UDP:flavonoid glycosyltransferase YjiC (YdhE family)
VGAECDVAVHNANHCTLARLLLAGRPMVQLPLTLEQTVLARAVDRTGAVETVLPGAQDVGEAFAQKLGAVKSDGRYADAARRFAASHADFEPESQVEKMVGRVEALLGRNRAGREEHVAPRAEAAWARPTEPRRAAPVFRGGEGG